MSRLLSFEELSQYDDEICKYCMCTQYGLYMNAPKIKPYSVGCEGAWCDDAYNRYVEENKKVVTNNYKVAEVKRIKKEDGGNNNEL